ncbi:nidogen-like domain-containing protein [Propionicimonas paludicola]|uniref:nidogen-like domain-containing protein n=1 Tax=Propionicimonas paludicola TaxID=185243 RepID=UPI001474811E|nr:nidogen-like domain-containing protein [Propionicimonas paludicola]
MAVLAVFSLAVGAAPSAMAADPVITFSVSGASNFGVYLCPWSGSTYTCGDPLTPTASAVSVPMADLTAGGKYAIGVKKSGYWDQWWHQSGFSTVKPTSTGSGEYVSAGASSIALGTATMKRKYQLSGSVTADANTRLGGIEVGIYANLSAVAAGTPLTGLTTSGDGTDKDLGTYDIDIPYSAPGTFVVGLKDPSAAYAQATETVSLAAAATSRDFTMRVNDHMITVGGTVVLGDAATPSGVSVDAFVWNTDSTWAPAASEESIVDGSYQLSIPEGRTFTLRFSKVGYRTVWLGGSYPGSPTDTNSRVANSLTSIDLVTLPEWTSAFMSVAGQNEDACNPTKGGMTLAAGGDLNQAVMNLGFEISFWGKKGSNLVVTDRGIAFLANDKDSSFNRTEIPDLGTWSGAPVLAPLWFDGDLSGAVADSVTYGAADGVACIRWNDVGHYSADDSAPNTFQLIITSRSGAAGRSAGDFDLTFNYDQVQWDASGTARVGYTAGDRTRGHYWVNPGVAGAIVDGGSSPLIASSLGSSTPGRYVFEVHNALVAAGPPTITGTPIVGATLTGHASTWSPTPDSLSYQWKLDGQPVSTASSYKVPSKSEGKPITLTVTAQKTGLTTVTSTVSAGTVLRVFSSQPTPKLSGTVKVGSTLTAKPGTWSPAATLSYQWFRGSSAISGATKSKYKVQLADVGQKLSARVTASKAGYLGVTKASAATKTVPKVTMKASTPKITGTTKVGSTLGVSSGSWTSGVTFSYQWYRSGKAINGATGSTYLLTIADKGKTLTVKVTGVRAGYTTAAKTSKSSKRIT